MNKINLDDWIKKGEGASSDTYFHKTDESKMLKVFKMHISYEYIENEYNVSKNVESLSFDIPKVYEIVDTGNGYGIIYERIVDKVSISRLCADNEENIEEYGKRVSIYVKKLHSTECDKNRFVDKVVSYKKYVANADINVDLKDRLYDLIDNTEIKYTCMHGDLNPSNFIMSKGKLFMIDLETFGYGNSLYDIGSMYWACKMKLSDEDKLNIFHMTDDKLYRFWDSFVKTYIDSDDKILLDDFEKKARLYSAFHTLIVQSMFPQYGREFFENMIESQMVNDK